MRAILLTTAIAAALLLPLAARPSAEISVPAVDTELQRGVKAPGSPWTEKPVFVPRDPFLAPAPEPHAVPASAPTEGPAERHAPPAVTVRAIAVGENSRALVDIGGVTRVVGVGDSVGSLQVTFIGVDRIGFSNGSTVPLESGSP